MTRDFRLLVALGVTGAAALAFEVIWSRALIPWVGGTAMAQVATVGVYMLGLFGGSVAASRRVESVRNPRQLFIRVEAAAALISFLMIWGIPLADPLFRALAQGSLLSGGLGAVLRGLAGGSLIFPATFLMGFGFPMAIAAYEKRGGGRSSTAWVYGVNTVGAALGALLGGFVLVPGLGILWGSVAVVVVDLLVLYWAGLRGSDGESSRVSEEARWRDGEIEIKAGEQSSSFEEPAMLLAVFLGGFVALGLEVMLFRILGLILGPTARTFTIVITSYVLGLGIGSLAARKFIKKSQGHARILFLGSWVLAGSLVLCIHRVVDVLPAQLSTILSSSLTSLPASLWQKALVGLVILLPLTCTFGAGFAAAVASGGQAGAKRAARLYAGLTLGNVSALVVAGLWILPVLGLEQGLLFFGGLCFLVPVLGLVGSGYRPKARALFVVVVAATAFAGIHWVQVWDWRAMLSAPYMYKAENVGKDRQILFKKSDFGVTVAVAKDRDNLFFSLDGKIDGGNLNLDQRTQSLIGVLGACLHPDPKKALVIGMGTGQTTADLLRFPLESVDCAELSPAVVESLPYFKAINRTFWEDPRYQLIQSDGRTVLRYGLKKYDLIISEPSNVWTPGVAHLFTREAFVEARKALRKPGGIFCQWLHTYRMDPDAFQRVLKTFVHVFPHVSVWGPAPKGTNIFLVGSLEPIQISVRDLEEKLAKAAVENHMAPGRKLDALSLLRTYLAGSEALRKTVKDASLLIDSRPQLEYLAEKAMVIQKPEHFYGFMAAISGSPDELLVDASDDFLDKLHKRIEANKSFLTFSADEKDKNGIRQPTLALDNILLGLSNLAIQYPDDLELRWEAAEQAARIGNNFLKLRRLDVAEQYYAKALEIWPEHSMALAHSVAVLSARRDFATAGDYLDRLDKVNPGIWPVLLRGQVFMMQGQYENALAVLDKAMKIDPISAHVYATRGKCLTQMGRINEARAEFKKVLELNPRSQRAHRELANLEKF